MDLQQHEELMMEVMPQGLRTPAFLLIGAGMCLFQGLSGLFCDPHDAKLGKFGNLDANWKAGASSMIAVGIFGAILLGITYTLSRRRPLFSAVLALGGFVAIFAIWTLLHPAALGVGIYIFGNLLVMILLAVGCVYAGREEAKIRRALELNTRARPEDF